MPSNVFCKNDVNFCSRRAYENITIVLASKIITAKMFYLLNRIKYMRLISKCQESIFITYTVFLLLGFT